MKCFRTTTTQENVVLITLNVESLVSANVQHVRQAILPTLRQRGRIVLDLGTLRYFDVTGFAELLHWIAKAKESGVVHMCSEQPEVHALLKLLRASSVLPFYWSKEEALSLFARDQQGSILPDIELDSAATRLGGRASLARVKGAK